MGFIDAYIRLFSLASSSLDCSFDSNALDLNLLEKNVSSSDSVFLFLLQSSLGKHKYEFGFLHQQSFAFE